MKNFILKHRKTTLELTMILLTFAMVILTYFAVNASYEAVKITSQDYKQNNRPFLSIKSYDSLVDVRNRTVGFRFYLQNTGRLPAKYITKDAFILDQNGQEYHIIFPNHTSVVPPGIESGRFIEILVPDEITESIDVRMETEAYIHINYGSIYESENNLSYYYKERYNLKLLNNYFLTIELDAN